jgi:hypothetical protein
MSEIRIATPHKLQATGWIAIAALAATGLAHVYAIVRSWLGPGDATGEIVATETSLGLSVFSFDDTTSAIINTARLVVLAAFVVWLYLARDNFDRRGDGSVDWRKGWTIGGWFVPLANLVIPNRVVGEIYVRSAPDRQWPAPRLVNLWWGGLLVSLFHYTESTVRAGGATAVHTPLFVAVITGGAGILAAVCAAVMIRRVSAWQDAKPA